MLTLKIKTIFQSLLLIVFTNSFAQNNYLSITCKPETNLFCESDFHLYKNDSLIHSNCYIANNESKLFHLEKGNYKIKYETIFGIDSITVNFKSKEGFKEVILETEKIDPKKLTKTFSYIESLKNNEQIVLKYSLSGCFVSKKKQATILKENNQYFFVDYRRKRLISKQHIKEIIWYEKVLKNLNFEENLHGTVLYVTCSEFFSLTKNEKQVYGKSVFCGTWSKSSSIKRLIR